MTLSYPYLNNYKNLCAYFFGYKLFINFLCKHLSVLFLIMCMVIIQPSQSLASCYTKKEAAAEQVIRLHSELLVIGLNCRDIQLSKQRISRLDTYEKYLIFSGRHTDLIRGYENHMLGYFKRQGISDPDMQLSSLRTQMANNIAEIVVKRRPDVFCHQYRERLDKANSMSAEQINEWAYMIFPSAPPSKRFCH